MRALLLRSLVVLLVLALAAGNAHAVLHLGGGHAEQGDHGAQDQAGGKAAPHQDGDRGCCCDCLGCISVFDLTPDPTIMPARLAGAVRYEARSAFLSGRSLLPEPDPPRPSALI